MKNKRIISILVIFISILATLTSILGLLNIDHLNIKEFISITGETVKIYGSGLYKNDSLSTVAQGQASDFITLIFAIPLLLWSLYLSIKGVFKGQLLLIGTLAYFLYTYVSYTFLWNYNVLFIVYVALMSMSFFALVLTIQTIDINSLEKKFSDQLPIKLLTGFQWTIGLLIGLLWIEKIASSILLNTPPVGLEHYTTLVIQAMDLGFVVPIAFLSGTLLLKKKPYGYLLTSIVIFKGVTMLTAITAMIINMLIQGITVSLVEIGVFIGLDIFGLSMLFIFLNGIKKE
jgi:hypothetical protein